MSLDFLWVWQHWVSLLEGSFFQREGCWGCWGRERWQEPLALARLGFLGAGSLG